MDSKQRLVEKKGGTEESNHPEASKEAVICVVISSDDYSWAAYFVLDFEV